MAISKCITGESSRRSRVRKRQQPRGPNYDRFPRRNDTRTWIRQFTRTQECEMDNAVLLYDDMRTKWPAVFGVSRTNRRASHRHPVLRRGGSKKGGGQHQPQLKRRRRRKSRRGWKHCSVPCAFLRVPPRIFFFFLFPHISYWMCIMRYLLSPPLPKATSNAPARAQVCPIVSRPTYRVLPSLLCVWPL